MFKMFKMCLMFKSQGTFGLCHQHIEGILRYMHLEVSYYNNSLVEKTNSRNTTVFDTCFSISFLLPKILHY